MVDMDEDQPQGGGTDVLEKIWAVAGLLAGAALIWMAVDLLRPAKTPEAVTDGSE
jgi:hypothetical protein